MRRTFQIIPTAIIMSIIVFLLMHLVPGGPLARLLGNPKIRPSTIHQLEVNLHLLLPWPQQYWLWVDGILHGQFGTSLVTYQPVAQMIAQHLPPTLYLMGTSLLLTVFFGFGLGVLQAVKKYSVIDYIFTVMAFFGFSLPTFFLGLLMLLVFAVTFGIFPAGGMVTPGIAFSLGDLLWHLVLPACTLAFVSIAAHSRYMRTQMLEVMNADYIRTAYAKGLPRFTILVKHAMRNALLPVVTLLALDLANVYAGAVITESVFAWPGMGTLFIQSIDQMDYPAIMALVMTSAILVMVFNFLADLVYAWIDPRISYN